MSAFYAASVHRVAHPRARRNPRSDAWRLLPLLAAWALVGIALTLSLAATVGPEVTAALASG